MELMRFKANRAIFRCEGFPELSVREFLGSSLSQSQSYPFCFLFWGFPANLEVYDLVVLVVRVCSVYGSCILRCAR